MVKYQKDLPVQENSTILFHKNTWHRIIAISEIVKAHKKKCMKLYIYVLMKIQVGCTFSDYVIGIGKEGKGIYNVIFPISHELVGILIFSFAS